MDFISGPPTFAVEVRSKGDYGSTAEVAMTAKRADYFAAGTLVVWDVDPRDKCIRVYRSQSPDVAQVFRKGQVADAEPAVPGWRLNVDGIFA
jgi:Uma2 family endonuclease